MRSSIPVFMSGFLLLWPATSDGLAQEARALQALIQQKCLKCHGGMEVNGEVDFKKIRLARQLAQEPDLLDRMINVIDDNTMPPEGEPQLDDATRRRLVNTLRGMLKQATANQETAHGSVRRLNRFQYNNTVKDLFQLKRDLFGLSEKLMTRHDNYLQRPVERMPDVVQVASHSLQPLPGLREVSAFPKDLRASHGFDNQADQLTLSPLLLDAFLRLSVSIVESPDFNEQTVGSWKELFQAPAEGEDVRSVVHQRLARFLRRAFREKVDDATVDRYTDYAVLTLEKGTSFTDSMKKVVSAVLSSPRFLYRTAAVDGTRSQFELASNLSYFLWGSCPDDDLLDLAEKGALSRPEVLETTLNRMLADPRIERFLDSFPSQWMQLENVLAATPDPAVNRYFSLDRDRPASLQMVLEPLLLFDATFVENRPIGELIAPEFSYRSPFLQEWYTAKLEPPPVDEARITRENKERNARIRELQGALAMAREALAGLDRAMVNPIAEKRIDVDLAPGQAAWEKAQEKLVDEAVTLSTWSRIGPFAAGSLDNAHAKAFIDETAVDLSKAYGDQKWVEVKEYVDGKVHALLHANCATYIYRTIQTRSARSLQLSLGSDDSFKLWLNGQLVADKKVTRGVAPDQDKVRVELLEGENTLLMKISNGGGGYGFYFKADTLPLPEPVVAVLQVDAQDRTEEQSQVLAGYYLSIAPELAKVRREISESRVAVVNRVEQLDDQLKKAPKPRSIKDHQADAQRRFDDQLRGKMRSRAFQRMPNKDLRYGGVITNAAMMSMTSGPKRTHPVARGVWIIEVIFNDPPAPPPNDVPPLNEESGPKDQTIREKFSAHRENPSCAGCHSKLDPLGFAMENYDITGRWRDQYTNGREVDASGILMRKHAFDGVVKFKQSLIQENERFARAFISHLLRFALARELEPADTIAIDAIVQKTRGDGFKLQSLMREVARSPSFLGQ